MFWTARLTGGPFCFVSTVENFTRQLESLGAMFDWSAQVNTVDPSYYRWTQWVFVQLFKRGLAYQKDAEVNWRPSCSTVLADEQSQGGTCERCSCIVEERAMRQWFLRITAYAEALLTGLDSLDWSEVTRTAQRHWIGKCVEAAGPGGPARTTYHLRDWCVSRQRYWGTPIPIVHCDACGAVPVAEEHLPVILPYVIDYQPDGSGRSPLARCPSFVDTTRLREFGASTNGCGGMPPPRPSSSARRKTGSPHACCIARSER